MNRYGSLACAALALAACKTEEPSATKPAASAAPSAASVAKGVEIVWAAGGDVAARVAQELERTRAQKRELVVYVGAKWCEPCQYFHAAAERGELDAAFPKLTLLEFDLDRDDARLRAAGYASQMIPLFAVPGPDGRASGKQMEGSIKGAGSVAEIAPRLQALTAR